MVLTHFTGRSNAINISEKLGLPIKVINTARQLYGTASAEINEVMKCHIQCFSSAKFAIKL